MLGEVEWLKDYARVFQPLDGEAKFDVAGQHCKCEKAHQNGPFRLVCGVKSPLRSTGFDEKRVHVS